MQFTCLHTKNLAYFNMQNYFTLLMNCMILASVMGQRAARAFQYDLQSH